VGVTAATTSATGLGDIPFEEQRALDRVPPVLSVIAGMVEVLGFLMLGGLFTGHVTGNIVVIAALLARGGSPTAPQVLALPTFTVALVVIWHFARALHTRGLTLLQPLLSIQFLLLTGVLLLAIGSDLNRNPNGTLGSLAAILATCAMASQFATMRLVVPGAPSTAVMTGNLTNVVLSFLQQLEPRRPLMQPDGDRLKKATSLIVGFCGGCVVGALAFSLVNGWAWTLPVGLSAGAIAVAPRLTRRSLAPLGASRPLPPR
jgi:uncharacterized membrane protein YoaK (UPF0700 family)